MEEFLAEADPDALRELVEDSTDAGEPAYGLVRRFLRLLDIEDKPAEAKDLLPDFLEAVDEWIESLEAIRNRAREIEDAAGEEFVVPVPEGDEDDQRGGQPLRQDETVSEEDGQVRRRS